MIDLNNELHNREILKQRRIKYHNNLSNTYILISENILFYICKNNQLATCSLCIPFFSACKLKDVEKKYNVKYDDELKLGDYRDAKKFLDVVFNDVSTLIFENKIKQRLEIAKELRFRGLP